MNHYSLVEKRIRLVVAISLVLLIAFAVRLIDVQAVRAAGYANRADLELAKNPSSWRHVALLPILMESNSLEA